MPAGPDGPAARPWLRRVSQLGEPLFPRSPDSMWKPEARPDLYQDGAVDIPGDLLSIGGLAQHPLVDDTTVRVGPKVVASPWSPVDRDRQLDQPGGRASQLRQTRRGLGVRPVVCVSVLLAHAPSLIIYSTAYPGRRLIPDGRPEPPREPRRCGPAAPVEQGSISAESNRA
jgi:hypothetical protein